MKFGSVCSGIEAASVAFEPINIKPVWFSEISEGPSQILENHYPSINNLGDMCNLPNLIKEGLVETPDLLCGGTPCQAFSFAGWKKGLNDVRGQLTIKFIEIADAIDERRSVEGKPNSIILWENVEGVLSDKTNAFGMFIAGLSGVDHEISVKKWEKSGVLFGPKRNIAWRVLDAKFFGLPQQRKRLFLIATDTSINPESILFEKANYSEELFSIVNGKKSKNTHTPSLFDEEPINKKKNSVRHLNQHKVEIFREYTDCLYTAYGTKWNGNAAAYNGSLYFSQNDKVRRLTPLECERLMGFSDNYTLVPGVSDTQRYQAIGNSWPIPVINWIGQRIQDINLKQNTSVIKKFFQKTLSNGFDLYLIKNKLTPLEGDEYLNTSVAPNNIREGDIFDIVQTDALDKFYLSSKSTIGILRRKEKLNINMNNRLEQLFRRNSET